MVVFQYCRMVQATLLLLSKESWGSVLPFIIPFTAPCWTEWVNVQLCWAETITDKLIIIVYTLLLLQYRGEGVTSTMCIYIYIYIYIYIHTHTCRYFYLKKLIMSIYFYTRRDHLHLTGKPLKLVDQFIYLDSNISSTENDVNLCLRKT